MDPSVIYWTVTAAVAALALALTTYNARNWVGENKFLCDDCKYNNPNDCLKPERPTALDCTAYRAKTN